ncbi:hypothetical protein DV738_g1469, partial [Chaetothyriales sp. CBS 135597]
MPPPKRNISLDTASAADISMFRIARGVLPPNTSLQKDALLALTRSATVFVSYLASQANELATRKTVQPADVIKALRDDFDRVEPVQYRPKKRYLAPDGRTEAVSDDD